MSIKKYCDICEKKLTTKEWGKDSVVVKYKNKDYDLEYSIKFGKLNKLFSRPFNLCYKCFPKLMSAFVKESVEHERCLIESAYLPGVPPDDEVIEDDGEIPDRAYTTNERFLDTRLDCSSTQVAPAF